MDNNVVRVRLTGGVDDTEYDRITRNPLNKDGLLIFEQACLPKKLNPKTLVVNAMNRSKEEYEELKQRKIKLLGEKFIPPKYNMTEAEMSQIRSNLNVNSMSIRSNVNINVNVNI